MSKVYWHEEKLMTLVQLFVVSCCNKKVTIGVNQGLFHFEILSKGKTQNIDTQVYPYLVLGLDEDDAELKYNPI